MCRLLDCLLEQLAQHLLHLRRTTEEELDSCCQHLKTNGTILLLHETIDHWLKQVGRILDEQAVLAKNPKHSAFALGLCHDLQATLDGPRRTLELLRILPHEILHHNCGLCANIVNVELQQACERAHDQVRRRRYVHRNLANGPNGLARDHCVDVGDILAQLGDDVLCAIRICEHGQDVNLHRLDVRGLVVSAEELLEIRLEDLDIGVASIDYGTDVHQNGVSQLWVGSCHECEHRALQTLQHVCLQVRSVAGQIQEDLRDRHDDAAAGLLQEAVKDVHDVEHFGLILHLILGQ
mmetsp:Transcript_61066/g.109965  ORF Transcript_61066/g.109965 Transcript_61066/m.109965 type:complete len:294 (+) Transcript_61066:615-1496(+)